MNKIQTHNKLSFAEITQSSLAVWKGQCWEWNNPPTFGDVVTVHQNNYIVYGIVTTIQTESLDPARTPVAYKKTEEELLHDQPQIFHFLKTTFQCVTIGYEQNGIIFYQLPIHPLKMHAFIAKAQAHEYEKIFTSDQFLHSIFNHSAQLGCSLDELLLGIIKNLSEHSVLHKNVLTQFIESFSLLNKNDYKKLKVFTGRVQYLLEKLNPTILTTEW
ncbi:hypothetical protein EBR77_04225 [bacterium]|jgi:hypothetical protein|nr:hypothetical protein [bacterium]NBX78115.1 hypothetical protein [bacterium]